MDLDSLLNNLDICGQFGHVVSTEDSLVLHNSLLLLQNENHFRKIYFWGRICGVDNDYYIAYGYVKDILIGRVFYYSTNCRDWGLLPNPNEQANLLSALCTAKFQGDAAIVNEIVIEKDETLSKKLKPQQLYNLKEEDRLAATIHLINFEVNIVPRGALYKRPDGVVVENLSFEGLDTLDAMEIKSYQHHRLPTEKWNINLLTREDYNYAIDFLDSIDMDIPTGCWSIQSSPGGEMAVLKSSYWPGYYFYHKIARGQYGSIYFGHGKKSLDIPFMLHPI